MNINTRNGHLVIGKHAVPVREVTNVVCDRRDMEYITNRYPISPQEVMDCIDCIADLDKLDQGIHLELANGSDDIGKVTIETRQMSDTFFLKTKCTRTENAIVANNIFVNFVSFINYILI